jgi:alpha,alpha-trehalose-phosphate synthase [UDP-forming]
MSASERLIVVSNRLPVTVASDRSGFYLESSGGGLVSALTPVLRETGGCWVGWMGTDYDHTLVESLQNWASLQNYSLETVFLNAQENALYYRGFSNEIIWPLFHGSPSRCQFRSAYWNGYCCVNRKFAEAVEHAAGGGDLIWVHDYHLMLLAQELRARGMTQRMAYFHHIPFPAADTFETLPWRFEVLRALMHFDLIGFQTARDRLNFVESLQRCAPDVQVSGVGEKLWVRLEDRCCKIGTYPISIDYRSFCAEASAPDLAAAAEKMRREFSGTRIVLGVDRLDYTKGILERLTAFQTLLESEPRLRGRVTMIQIVVPSREDIAEYMQLRLRIERLISSINGEYSSPGWVPIHYFHRSVSRSELVAFYRAADVALVTPLKDGMNLVAKEFCAARVDNRGVLILSEFAGAAAELRTGALLVNPHDTDRVASVLAAALRMTEAEQCVRMERMRSQIESHDVFCWSQAFRVQADQPPAVIGHVRATPAYMVH